MKFILLLLLSLNIFASGIELSSLKKLSIEEPKILLNTIFQHAIRIGTGDKNIYYIFVDPMCPYSKNLIKLISKDKLQQIQTSYYVFLYRLPKFESDKLIQYIYQSNDAQTALLNIMVNNKKIDLTSLKVDSNKSYVIKNIANIGKKLKMKKRPYMITFTKGSNYCSVSEGSAPCLEEFDF